MSKRVVIQQNSWIPADFMPVVMKSYAIFSYFTYAPTSDPFFVTTDV